MKKSLLYLTVLLFGFQQVKAQCTLALCSPNGSSSTSTLCGDPTGSGTATVNVCTGAAPFTYLWSDANSQTTATATGLTAGNYTVTVEDNDNCILSTEVSVATASGISISYTRTNVSCNGLCNGGNTVTATGGALPYTYTWSKGSQNTNTSVDNISSLCAGIYSVTVTDANGCNTQTPFIITQPAAMRDSIVTASTSNPTCFGQNGTVDVGVKGGTSPYTYTWNPPGSAEVNPYTTSAGSYAVTVTDKNGCTATVNDPLAVTITQPPLLTVSPSTTPVTCSTQGTACSGKNGGTPPYTYSWSVGGATTDCISGLSAGTYSITVTDNNGCTASNTAVVTATPTPTVTATPTNITCNGANNGLINTSISGGTSPFTYSWSPGGATTAEITGLGASCFTVTVTDAIGCSGTASACVTEPPPLITTPTITAASCNLSNGSASPNASGGTSPYTYLWNDAGSQTGATATGLSAACYTVTVTDNNNCSTSAQICVTQPPPVNATFSITNPLCIGGTGSIQVNPSAGAPPYTYSWSDASTQTTQTATGLLAGNYTVTITDNSGCIFPFPVTLTQPGVLRDSIVTASIVNVTCIGQSTGSAMVGVKYGTTPYTYAWSDASSQSTATATGLSAGTYSVTVQDNCGASASASVQITQPLPLALGTPASTGALCNGSSSGTATANPSNGTPPYTYSWNPTAQTGQEATGLSTGTYTVTVMDNCGNSVTSSVSITEPNPLALSPVITEELCAGGNNGSIAAGVTGGTTPYTYLWSDAGSQTNATATGLPHGCYTVVVTDNNGCSITTTPGTMCITQPSPIIIPSFAVTDPLCNGGLGSLGPVSPSGGTAPYTYQWNDASSQTTATASNLVAGDYTVTVTDNNGCSKTRGASITQPAAISAPTSTTPASCGRNDGTASVTASGGTGTYNYQWSDGASQTGTTATGLGVGTYTITVTDDNGCTGSNTAVVAPLAALVASVADSSNITCNGLTNGSITIGVSGGAVPYTYTWTPNVSTTNSAAGLSAGTYTIVIHDTTSCDNTQRIVTLTQPAILAGGTTSTGVLCNGGSTGTATANPTGGTTPYTYLWNDGSSQTTQTASNLSMGCYTVTVTDANACSTTLSQCVSQPAVLGATINPIDYPTCIGGTGDATANPTGGTTPYTYQWNDGSSQTTAEAIGLVAGNYTVSVTDNNGCSFSASVDITQPGVLRDSIVTAAAVAVRCNGGSTGSATVGVKYGTTPYTYSWSDASSQSTPTANGLSAGTYTVTVQDNCGASVSTSVQITEPLALLAGTATSTPIACGGGSTGTATANPSNGTTPYTYSWSPGGATTVTASNLSAGTYTVTVQDNCGASETASVTITQATPLSLGTPTSTGVLCNGGSTGTASITATAGSTPYTYSWSPGGATTATASNLSAGTYTVTVSDNCGASETASVTVTQPAAALSETNVVTNAICAGTNSGSILLTVMGGTSPYTYAWSNSATTQNIDNILPGTYTVTITDANGCATDTTLTVGAHSAGAIFANAGKIQTIFSKDMTVTLGGSPTGPAGSSYVWSPDISLNSDTVANPIASPSATTLYTVTVKDSAGCTVSDTVTVEVFPGIIVPNVLTPDYSKDNTLILPFAGDFPNMEVTIYDRWGASVYHSSGAYTPWDGANKGTLVAAGTYFYVITLNDPKFPGSVKGFITVIR